MKKLHTVLLVISLCIAPLSHADDVRDACSALVIDYAQYRDQFDAESFANLFTEDGILIIGESRWEGRDAIRARIEALDSSTTIRHHMSSIRITQQDAHHATGVSYAVIYSSPAGSNAISGPALIGDYIDRYVLTEDGWRISHRELVTTHQQR
ncbi:MAG: hypothetical protein PsegKO_06370 [Pseudohongiellaceae bacterium]|jgi:uncharacterized protein (TIGR02246 family)